MVPRGTSFYQLVTVLDYLFLLVPKFLSQLCQLSHMIDYEFDPSIVGLSNRSMSVVPLRPPPPDLI